MTPRPRPIGIPRPRLLPQSSGGAGFLVPNSRNGNIALGAALGEITPMPDAAIFADTGAEPAHIYRWLDWLETQLPFPVYRIMHKDGLLQNLVESINGGRFAGAPFFTETENRSRDSGRLRRHCTREFKITPITQKVRELCGLKKGERAPKGEILAVQWIGISLDEIVRMKDPREKWLQHRWPLIEMRETRWHCLQWMKDHGYPEPSKSSCTFCPYHDNAHWLDMKQNDPESWEQAVMIDEMVRGGVRGTTQKLYVHRSMVPLREADLTTPESAGQMDMLEECDGMCGV